MGMVRVSEAASAPSASTYFARFRSAPQLSSSSLRGTPVNSEHDSKPCVYCTVGAVARKRSLPVFPLHSMK